MTSPLSVSELQAILHKFSARLSPLSNDMVSRALQSYTKLLHDDATGVDHASFNSVSACETYTNQGDRY